MRMTSLLPSRRVTWRDDRAAYSQASGAGVLSTRDMNTVSASS